MHLARRRHHPEEVAGRQVREGPPRCRWRWAAAAEAAMLRDGARRHRPGAGRPIPAPEAAAVHSALQVQEVAQHLNAERGQVGSAA